MLLLMLLPSLCTSVHASSNLLPIGTFDGDVYMYDSDVKEANGIKLVWVFTKSQRFNLTDDKDYGGAAGRFGISCSTQTSVFLSGMTITSKGKIIQSGEVPEKKWNIVPIIGGTPQSALYFMLCQKHIPI